MLDEDTLEDEELWESIVELRGRRGFLRPVEDGVALHAIENGITSLSKRQRALLLETVFKNLGRCRLCPNRCLPYERCCDSCRCSVVKNFGTEYLDVALRDDR
jgi:hypothetical protein